MNIKKQFFLRVDLNNFYDGRFPFRNPKAINDIEVAYGEIKDGLKIWLFELTKHNGKYDPTLFPGVIKSSDGQLEILVDEADMVYLSESEQFKNYSIEDVIGTEWFNALKTKDPGMDVEESGL